MRYLFIICVVMSWCSPLFAVELRLTTDLSDNVWLARDPPQHPQTETEILAAQAVATKLTATQDNLTAYYYGKKDSFDFITVEVEPETKTEGFHSVTSYLFRDGRIWFDTRLKYVAKPDPKHEQIAREMAIDYLLGRGGNMPALFKGSSFLVDYDGKCILTVTEMDQNFTVQFIYRYTCCN